MADGDAQETEPMICRFETGDDVSYLVMKDDRPEVREAIVIVAGTKKAYLTNGKVQFFLPCEALLTFEEALDTQRVYQDAVSKARKGRPILWKDPIGEDKK